MNNSKITKILKVSTILLTCYCIVLIIYGVLSSYNVDAMTLLSNIIATETTTEVTTQTTTEATTTSETTTETTTISTTTTETTTVSTTVETTTELTTKTQWVPSLYSSIENRGDLTIEDIRKVINYYRSLNGIMIFEPEYFYNAAQISGLDPIYIFAHACVESGFGQYDAGKYNYFGIGCFDGTGSTYAYAYESINDGIVKGSVWIRQNYFDNGQTSVYTMRHSPNNSHNYCTSNTWEYSIEDIMITSYEIIKS
jgi:beta-N-acetylglucosaminidase